MFLIPLLLVGLAILTLLALVLVIILTWRSHWLIKATAIGLSLIPIAAFLLWIGPADYTNPRDLADAYRTEFGSYPPEDVRDIQCRQVIVGDCGAAWMRFTASKNTVDTLLTKFHAAEPHEFDRASVGANVPQWWQPGQSQLTHFYTADGWSPHFSSSKAWIGLDADHQVVYFHHVGND